ncbi:hypothetical protein Y032_0002g1074 [Ancylostoma ceylanicum]|uniref:DUF4440 domain-containing protein n=2 Tax=Ancylostoma ceylanicum TaxID=53326 RepID=A0A016VZA8_9BILA|nr:hypothetical protein Y032_0002g1074 [Ancylostoma ceylanicum]
MSSSEDAKSILKPILDEYSKALDDGDCDKAAEFYHPDSVLITTGRRCVYGRDEIKKELMEFDEIMGKTTTELSEEHYRMTGDYVIFSADFETTTENVGVIRGAFTQIWKKFGEKYLIIHDMF